MKESHHWALFSFICRARAPEPIALFPTNWSDRILTFGPSSILNVRWINFADPGISWISCVTVANWKPFSFSMSRTIPSTFFTRPGSMKVSRRITALASFSLSSIFDDSTCLDPT